MAQDVSALFGNFDPFGAYAKGAAMRKQWDTDAALKDTFSNMPIGADGKPDYMTAAQKLFAVGATGPGLGLAQLAMAQADKENARNQWQQSFGLQQQQLARQSANDARQANQWQQTYDLQRRAAEGEKVPPNFRRGANGALEPIPGGPADPEYIRKSTESKSKDRNLSVGDIGKLTEEGTKFQNISGFGQSFRPEFAGYGSSTVGNIAMTAGRFLPNAVLPEGTEAAASWWQGYDRYKNMVRNELFGSALTTGETAAFEKADINPGMKPDMIQRNLAEQKRIVEAGAKRKAAAMVQSGYNADAISSAFGMTPEQLGIAGMKKGGAASEPTQQPLAAPQAGQPRTPSVPGARQAPDGKFYAPDPARPGKWLRVDD